MVGCLSDQSTTNKCIWFCHLQNIDIFTVNIRFKKQIGFLCSANKGINFPHCFYLVMFCLHVHTHTQTSKSFLLFLVVKSEYSSLPVQHSSHFTLPVSSHNTSRTPILLSITTICLLFSINVTLHFLPASTLSFYAQTHTLTFTLGMGASSCILKWLILFLTLQNIFLNKI